MRKYKVIGPFIYASSSAFVMTCKPPLYMGPEYIKYFSDKTIDVSVTDFDELQCF